ncbi:MAG: transposase [Gammaproteobacteria bacterium]|nr:transposase [Gammaproteobacteria bacterium]
MQWANICAQRDGLIARGGSSATPEFQGRAMHDHFRSYFTFDQCQHALCNAHHLRELQFITEQYQQEWAEAMSALLLEIKEAVVQAKEEERTDLRPEQLQAFHRRYDAIIQQGLAAIRHRRHRRSRSGGVANRHRPKTCWTGCTNTRRKLWPL